MLDIFRSSGVFFFCWFFFLCVFFLFIGKYFRYFFSCPESKFQDLNMKTEALLLDAKQSFPQCDLICFCCCFGYY